MSGCATPSPAERAAHGFQLAAAQGWTPLRLSTERFDLQAFVPPGLAASSPRRLAVYIEGDGLAWVDRSTPAFAPTPADPLALRLAMAHADGPAVYIGRPCQYTEGAAFRHCHPRYWTSHRFAPEVIAALGQGLQQLKQFSGARELVLVGYSGGAVVAALLAAQRNDVAAWVTVAGPLDTDAWTQTQGLSPLRDSLNPVAMANTLATKPQWHFAGRSDTVVPPTVLQRFLEVQAASGHPRAVLPEVLWLEGFDHGCCWVDAWPRLSRAFSHSDTAAPVQPQPAGPASGTNR